MTSRTIEVSTVAEGVLRLLGERGVDYLFANAGTDFAPLIEAYAGPAVSSAAAPKPVLVPHENVAVHLALGHYLMSGRAQAVMVHVSVGTANAVCGLMNAARAEIPVLFLAGRTPYTEAGLVGSRNVHIHWTQEMFDQGGMVREFVKWDYELRHPSQVATVVDRALSIAGAQPRGPVYLTLPREVLAHKLDTLTVAQPRHQGIPTPPHPDPAAIERLADLLRAAESPVIVTTGLGLDPSAVAALEAVADRAAVPVVQHAPRCVSLPDTHAMHAGYDPKPWLADADLVVVVDSVVPWIPDETRPLPDAPVVQIGVDPLHARIPVRGFECDLAISGTPAAALALLDEALASGPAAASAAVLRRRARMETWQAERRAQFAGAVERASRETPIHPVWLSHCLGRALDEDAVVFREAPQLALPYLPLDRPGRYFTAGSAGGLGWGLGAAIGAKLAAPDRLVVLVVGDGSYMFGSPVSAHYVAMEQDAPILTIILNNRRWNEVQRATRHLYPDGFAARHNEREPLTYFDERLSLETVVAAAGGHGERVTDPAALPDALARAIRMVREERRQVVLDVICSS